MIVLLKSGSSMQIVNDIWDVSDMCEHVVHWRIHENDDKLLRKR